MQKKMNKYNLSLKKKIKKWKNNHIFSLMMIVIVSFSIYFVDAAEWDCSVSSNTGTFTRSTDCTISGSDHVALSNTLEVIGSNTDMDNLITITAATNQRHFYLNHANAKLILRYLKLVGGDVSSYTLSGSASFGGSICIYTNGGELNLYSSIVFNNKAAYGGGIYAQGASSTNKNAIMNIYNSIIHTNEATTNGGGIYAYVYTVSTIYNTTIANSQASDYGGGMAISSSDVTMKNTIISNNDAGNGGGGLHISGDSTTVTLRQLSFINNNATNNGDEIYTHKSPTISLINTYFKNPNNNNNIYEHSSGTPTFQTCSQILCTETPFTGTCNAVNPPNTQYGIHCDYDPNLCPQDKFLPDASFTRFIASSMSTIPSCRFPPRITKLHPDKTSTFGYIQTNIFGEYFGDISTPIPIVQFEDGEDGEDGTKWTDVTRHNTTYITAKTPLSTA